MESAVPDISVAKRPPEMTTRKLAIFLLATAMCGASACWFFVRAPRSRASRPSIGDGDRLHAKADLLIWRSAAGYAGSQACRDCHPHEYQTYRETSHSRAMSKVVPDQQPPDGVFDHNRSGRRYRVTRREGRLMHEESLLLDDGEEMKLSSYPVTYAVGSGHFGKTYLCEADGFLFESPITWYEPRQTWGMSPGYDKAEHKAFTRVVPENCLLCHAGNVETRPDNDLKMRIVEESIGCERCHGPGQAHVERQTAAQNAGIKGDDSIINPQRLSRKLSEAVCQQCHLQGDLQVVGRGVRSGDFRPGLPLERFRCEFRMRKPGSGMTIVGHFEQLGQSACYRQSESFTCVTCHDPHVTVPPARRAEHFRSVCMSCHAEPGCKVALETRQQESHNECVACHMPSSHTEVPHVAFTHHRIGIHPLQNESTEASGTDAIVPLSDLSALSDSDRRRTLLLVRLHLLRRMGPGVLQTPGGQEFARQFDESLQSLPADAIDAEVEVAGAEFYRICGNTREATFSAERALQRDDIGTNEEFRALALLATVALEQRRFSDASRWFTRLSALRRDAMALYHLGLCQINCGEPSAAIRSFEASCDIDPANIGTLEALELLYRERQEFDQETRVRAIIDRLNRRSVKGSH